MAMIFLHRWLKPNVVGESKAYLARRYLRCSTMTPLMVVNC